MMDKLLGHRLLDIQFDGVCVGGWIDLSGWLLDLIDDDGDLVSHLRLTIVAWGGGGGGCCSF